MKEKPDAEKYEKDAIESCRKIEEDQTLMNEIEENLKKETVNEGLILFAMYFYFMDCDL